MSRSNLDSSIFGELSEDFDQPSPSSMHVVQVTSTPVNNSRGSINEEQRGNNSDLSIEYESFPSLTTADLSDDIRENVTPDPDMIQVYSKFSPDHLHFKHNDLLPDLKSLLRLMAKLRSELQSLEEKRDRLSQLDARSALITELKIKITACRAHLTAWSELGQLRGIEMRSIQEAIRQLNRPN